MARQPGLSTVLSPKIVGDRVELSFPPPILLVFEAGAAMTDQQRHQIQEADIGSGEKPPSQRDTEKLIEEVGKENGDARDGRDKQSDAERQKSGKH